MHTALVVHPDGTREAVVWRLPNEAYPVIRAAVGGYVEQVSLAPDLVMFVDEDGLMKRLPRNVPATVLVHEMFPGRLWADTVLVGPVVLAGEDGSENLAGLTSGWIARLGVPGAQVAGGSGRG